MKCIMLLYPFSLILCAGLVAQTPYPRISEEAFRARLGFYVAEKRIPLDARVVRQWDSSGTLREKIVFRGAQGFLVPGYLEFPKTAAKPYPLVMLLHGWSGSKEDWYVDGNNHSGGEMRKALAGCRLRRDGAGCGTHGERNAEIDYQHVNPFSDPNAPPRQNYFTYAEISVQTVKDYPAGWTISQRAATSTCRASVWWLQHGRMDSFYLLSVEPRIRVAVACGRRYTARLRRRFAHRLQLGRARQKFPHAHGPQGRAL
jgi:hypothetical protein